MTCLVCIGEEVIQRTQLSSPVVHHSPVGVLLSSALVVLQDASNKNWTQRSCKPHHYRRFHSRRVTITPSPTRSHDFRTTLVLNDCHQVATLYESFCWCPEHSTSVASYANDRETPTNSWRATAMLSLNTHFSALTTASRALLIRVWCNLCSKQLKLDLRQNVNLTPSDRVAVAGPSGQMA